MAGAGAGAEQAPPGPQAPGAAPGGGPREGPDWAGLPEDLLVKIAGMHIAQTEAGWAAWLKVRCNYSEERIQEEMAERERDGNCPFFVFARVCKPWRKAQLKVGGPLRTRVDSDVLLPGSVTLVKWALAEGCPREDEDGITMAEDAALHGNLELVKWLCGEGGFTMDENMMMEAAGSGNLELFRWLRAEGCPWDRRTCSCAVNKGHVEVLRWVRENGCPWSAGIRAAAAVELGYTDDLGNLDELADQLVNIAGSSQHIAAAAAVANPSAFTANPSAFAATAGIQDEVVQALFPPAHALEALTMDTVLDYINYMNELLQQQQP